MYVKPQSNQLNTIETVCPLSFEYVDPLNWQNFTEICEIAVAWLPGALMDTLLFPHHLKCRIFSNLSFSLKEY